MNRKIRVVQYGTGKMAKVTMHYVLEQGGELVGAIDKNPTVIGKDLGELIGEKRLGIVVTDYAKAEEMLKEVKPDICIIETMSFMQDIKDAMMLCAKLGINAITTGEEAFYPWNSSPHITKEIDDLAKKSNCTISGTGYQDIYWGQLISSIAGSTHKISKIKGSSSYNVEDYGIALAKAHGAGLSLEDFEKEIASADDISQEERKKKIENEEFAPSYMWNVNGWLCEKLGLTVISQVQKCVPKVDEEDLYSSTLNMTIPKGKATGMSAVVTTTTKEGIILETECIGKVYNSKEFDKNEWTIEGEPTTSIVVEKPDTVKLTCATIVNRIPDVINAKSGYITTNQMGELNYRAKPLQEYVH